ncbi:MAG: site-specific integrase [Deltaproteobacteria bacterium]|nr:site-specific integrase [Deltaproteobacteria bacterium]MBM4283860.1 site-specific integrase [Deltaproteobacteria bacterium]
MAIQIFCPNCKSSSGLDAKECSKCGAVFGRDKKYRVCVSVKGHRITRVVDNLTLAREVQAAVKGDLVRGEYEINRGVKEAPTLGELWAKYLPWAKEHKKTWKCDSYNYQTHLEPRFAKKPLDRISSLDIERLKLEMKKGINKQGRPFSQATIKHQLVLLKRLYNLAKRWGLYEGINPMDRVEVPKLDNLRTEYLSEDETRRLMQTLDSWPCRDSAAFVKFTLFTGMRRGELFKLTWNDVDFERGMITLREPKGGKTQTLPISEPALNVLRSLTFTSTYVFPGKGGEQRTDFKGPWQRIRKAAGLPDNFRFHGLRHHFASTLVSNGIDLCVVQALLTHKDSRTTQRYSHLKPGAIKDAAMKSADLLRPKDPASKVVNLQEKE